MQSRGKPLALSIELLEKGKQIPQNREYRLENPQSRRTIGAPILILNGIRCSWHMNGRSPCRLILTLNIQVKWAARELEAPTNPVDPYLN